MKTYEQYLNESTKKEDFLFYKFIKALNDGDEKSALTYLKAGANIKEVVNIDYAIRAAIEANSIKIYNILNKYKIKKLHKYNHFSKAVSTCLHTNNMFFLDYLFKYEANEEFFKKDVLGFLHRSLFRHINIEIAEYIFKSILEKNPNLIPEAVHIIIEFYKEKKIKSEFFDRYIAAHDMGLL